MVLKIATKIGSKLGGKSSKLTSGLGKLGGSVGKKPAAGLAIGGGYAAGEWDPIENSLGGGSSPVGGAIEKVQYLIMAVILIAGIFVVSELLDGIGTVQGE